MIRKKTATILERVKWYEKMVETYKSLPDLERIELNNWDKEKSADQDVTDWPGWKKYIGPKPQNPDLIIANLVDKKSAD
jgi:hypothetical protein